MMIVLLVVMAIVWVNAGLVAQPRDAELVAQPKDAELAAQPKASLNARCGGGCILSSQCVAWSGDPDCRCTWFTCR